MSSKPVVWLRGARAGIGSVSLPGLSYCSSGISSATFRIKAELAFLDQHHDADGSELLEMELRGDGFWGDRALRLRSAKP